MYHHVRSLRLSSLIVVCLIGICVCSLPGDASDRRRGSESFPASPDRSFFQKNCYDCHQGDSKEGGLDLAQLGVDLDNPHTERHWIRVFDRIQSGEMPPPESGKLPPQVTQPVLEELKDWISQFQRERQSEQGRVQGRRLTRREMDRTLRDLLGIQKPLLKYYQEEPKQAEFSTVAQGQSLSDVTVGEHLKVIDIALNDAFRRAQAPEIEHKIRAEAVDLVQKKPHVRNRLPVLREGKAAIWSYGALTYCPIPRTKAPEDGWYRFRFQHSGFHLPEWGSVWGIAYDGDNYLEYGNNFVQKWITAFESTEQPDVVECEAWLGKGHSLYIRPGEAGLRDIYALGGYPITEEGELKGKLTTPGHVDLEEGQKKKITGIALDWMEMEKIQRGPTNEEIRRRLFGDIPFRAVVTGKPDPKFTEKLNADANNSSVFWNKLPTQNVEKYVPMADSVTPEQFNRLMVSMASRAFRRPVTENDIRGYCNLVHEKWAETRDLIASLRIGYRALLCSPRFLCHTAQIGELDSYAVASRLSYMLTGSLPDEELTQLAAANKLNDPAILRQQVNRLLSGPGGRQFVMDFADEWLDLNQIDFTEPERKLVPDFDKVVERSMLEETWTYLETMLRENVGVRDLVHSDYTFLNSRLARYYEITGVTGDQMRRVKLKPEDHRGGLLTHGSVLKVTSNGSQTSPVVRGAWVAKRIMGEHIPPPPPNISAVEPDIRGARTIRELLEKHRDNAACASCHAKMDPPGFALENFDPGGKWRKKYYQVVNGQRVAGLPIDPSYVLPDGRPFQDIQDLQNLLASRPKNLARNLTEKLLVYGTGAPITFVDREEVDRIVAKVAGDNFGFRSIVYAVTTSPLFLTK